MYNLNEEINEALNDLEISNTFFENAKDKYEALGKFLEAQGVLVEIKPMGSFATGTVVKPYRNGKDKNYDLDVIALVKSGKDASYIRLDIESPLILSERYKDKIESYDECVTINYANIGDVDFSIDVVAAQKIIETNMVIKNGNKYEFKKTTCLEFVEWFKQANSEFDMYEKRRFQSINKEYASIEDIPEYKVKTSIQKTIQYLKRTRDIFYDRADVNDLRPESVLISYIVADIAQTMPNDSKVGEILHETIKYLISNLDNLNNLSNEFIAIDWSFEKKKKFREWISSLNNTLNLDNKDRKQLIRSSLGVSLASDNVGSTQPWSTIE